MTKREKVFAEVAKRDVADHFKHDTYHQLDLLASTIAYELGYEIPISMNMMCAALENVGILVERKAVKTERQIESSALDLDGKPIKVTINGDPATKCRILRMDKMEKEDVEKFCSAIVLNRQLSGEGLVGRADQIKDTIAEHLVSNEKFSDREEARAFVEMKARRLLADAYASRSSEPRLIEA